MMTQYEIVLGIMKTIKNNHVYITDHRGTGYCSYASELLNQALTKIGIKSIILGGSWFNKTTEADTAHDYALNLITSATDESLNPHLLKVKQQALKYGRLNPKSGHVVVLIKTTVYDLTAGQFDLPDVYNIDLFKKIFKKISVCEVSIKDKDNYGVVRSKPFTPLQATVMENW
jgi:hypothetical protein